ncbi:hypothetical protein [Desulforhopalus sp. IMCC35007]|uniref:hypothetical protein n=1 Tax=Desulforhopalus sp. IMCC35007 TaxID=2569543 RepID=UPI00145D062D|nr:hypothetical protein [Desulforhopalus sp. IMCC35007]
MTDKKPNKILKYTCVDYRTEMRLLGMRQQLSNSQLTDAEKKKLQNEIDQLEKEMGLT